MIRAMCPWIATTTLFGSLFISPVHAQAVRGYDGVFVGYENGRFVMRTTAHSIGHWVVDSATQFEGMRPVPGDWVYALVEQSGHITNLRFTERPEPRTGTISASNGDTLTVQSGIGTEEWNVVDTTQLIGTGRGTFAPGEQIAAQVFRNHNMATVRLIVAGDGPGVSDDDGGEVITVREPPPPLPVYEQPPCPEPDYLWTPGYWHWGSSGYFWVPGTWVAPPRVGLLWTPGFWGFVAGAYMFHTGYWGEHVGYYGGVHYGGGYFGEGFSGGRWEGSHMMYNTAVVNVNTTVIHNTYVNKTVINNTTINNVSYSGGAGGARSTMTPAEIKQSAGVHVPPSTVQQQAQHQASLNPQLLHVNNHGVPPVLATPRPLQYQVQGKTVTPTSGGGLHKNSPPTYGDKPTATTPSGLKNQPLQHQVMPVNSQHPQAPREAAPSTATGTPNQHLGQHPAMPVNSHYLEPHPVAAQATGTGTQNQHPSHVAVPVNQQHSQPQRVAAPATGTGAQNQHPSHVAAPVNPQHSQPQREAVPMRPQPPPHQVAPVPQPPPRPIPPRGTAAPDHRAPGT